MHPRATIARRLPVFERVADEVSDGCTSDKNNVGLKLLPQPSWTEETADPSGFAATPGTISLCLV